MAGVLCQTTADSSPPLAMGTVLQVAPRWCCSVVCLWLLPCQHVTQHVLQNELQTV